MKKGIFLLYTWFYVIVQKFVSISHSHFHAFQRASGLVVRFKLYSIYLSLISCFADDGVARHKIIRQLVGRLVCDNARPSSVDEVWIGFRISFSEHGTNAYEVCIEFVYIWCAGGCFLALPWRQQCKIFGVARALTVSSWWAMVCKINIWIYLIIFYVIMYN
jgi:hypothetical protein